MPDQPLRRGLNHIQHIFKPFRPAVVRVWHTPCQSRLSHGTCLRIVKKQTQTIFCRRRTAFCQRLQMALIHGQHIVEPGKILLHHLPRTQARQVIPSLCSGLHCARIRRLPGVKSLCACRVKQEQVRHPQPGRQGTRHPFRRRRAADISRADKQYFLLAHAQRAIPAIIPGAPRCLADIQAPQTKTLRNKTGPPAKMPASFDNMDNLFCTPIFTLIYTFTCTRTCTPVPANTPRQPPQGNKPSPSC
jgi:hypothetical protein